jgi:adenosylcobyric acid synthase
LRLHPEVDFRFVGPHGDRRRPADLIVLPGSKAVQRRPRLAARPGLGRGDPKRHLRYGGKLIGICAAACRCSASALHDPLGLEGEAGSMAGLGWLDYETRLAAGKTLENVAGTLLLPGSAALAGYRIHMGVSRGPALEQPAAMLAGAADGALSDDGQILATYCHGLFDSPPALAALLTWAGHHPSGSFDPGLRREQDIERLADAVEQSLDLRRLTEWLPLPA